MEQDIELIEKYLSGELESSQVDQVEARLKSDPEFAQRLEIIKGTKVALSGEVEDFRNTLQEVFDEYRGQHEERATPPFYKRPYLIAASLVLLIGVYLGYTLIFQVPSGPELYANNFSVPAENLTVRNQETGDRLSEALAAYNQDDYQQALNIFEDILKDNPQHQGVLFYSGICQLVLNQDDQARQTFLTISSQQNGEYSTAAQWYLGLAYLKIGDAESAKATLSELGRSGNGKYSRDASILLEKIK